MYAHCQIVYRKSGYVAFWDVKENGEKIYKYSDMVMWYPADPREHYWDGVMYQRMVKKVNENDPFVGRKVHS